MHGYQVEIANEKSGNTGGIFDETRRGRIGEIAPGSACSRAYHEVMANGDPIQTWVNGFACADIHDSMDKSGFIALQVHEYNGAAPVHVWFKNIRWEELAWTHQALRFSRLGRTAP